MNPLKTIARRLFLASGVLAFLFCLGSLHLFTSGLDRLTQDLELDSAPEASLVFDRRGNLVFSFASEDRTNVSLDQISSDMIAAVLTAEDRNFFRHAGMDIFGIVRAAWVDLKARAVRQGGSTITQQLIRNVLLSPDRNVGRKIKETLLALRIERRFRKEAILEAYLNRIYLGEGHYGLEAAARGYFGKSAATLTLPESALLAGIIPCPSVCSPRVSQIVARTRRDTVLQAMRQRGAITEESYRHAAAAAVELAPARGGSHAPARGLYFLEAVRRQVMDQFGVERVLEGGLRIHTTLDTTLQQFAEDAIVTRLSQLDTSGGLQGALVALDPETGDILALVGGRDFNASPFNRAIQARRQPGSAFKPLLFAAALEQGYPPSQLLTGIDVPIQTAQGAWLPSGQHEAASYTLRQALAVSSNRAAVRVMQMVGVTTTQTYARRLGITSPLPAVPSLALGTGEVTLLNLTSAYGAFANRGIVAPPGLVTRVDDRSGTMIWQRSFDERPRRAIREGTAYLMSSMLADAMNRGTGVRARAEGFRRPAAGKTGTTDDYGDAWFVGYTPHLVAGVWFGYDEKKPIMNRGFAATVAVPAWARFMIKATTNDKPDWYDMPPDVERIAVCRRTGMRAGADCRIDPGVDGRPNVYEELFMRGTGPYETCPGHSTDPSGSVSATTVPSAGF